MNRRFTFPVKLTKQKEGGYLVEFPDLPEAITQGESSDEALTEAVDCLEEAIANRMAMKMPIPVPKRIVGRQQAASLSATIRPDVGAACVQTRTQTTVVTTQTEIKFSPSDALLTADECWNMVARCAAVTGARIDEMIREATDRQQMTEQPS